MNTQEEARKAMVENRQKKEHTQQTMLSRSEENLVNLTNPELVEESRELIAEKRQDEKHRQESILSRSEEEINTSKA